MTTTSCLTAPAGVDVFKIGVRTYAVVASGVDDGLQIVDVTDPANPNQAGSLGDGNNKLLDGATAVDVFMLGGSKTYAAVASFADDGLQIVDVTDPASPSAAGSLGDVGSMRLNGAHGVAVFEIGVRTYAAVASFVDDGLQIVDVTDPDNLEQAGSLRDDNNKLLNGAAGVDVFTIGTSTYAAVASRVDDGLQIVDVTDPDNPTAAGSLGDDNSMELDGATTVDIFELGTSTYAAVASRVDDGLQIVDVTDPDNPTAAGSLGDIGSRELDGATTVDIFELGTSTYAAVASRYDNGLQIVNVTDPDSPYAVGSLGDDRSRLLNGAPWRGCLHTRQQHLCRSRLHQ